MDIIKEELIKKANNNQEVHLNGVSNRNKSDSKYEKNHA